MSYLSGLLHQWAFVWTLMIFLNIGIPGTYDFFQAKETEEIC